MSEDLRGTVMELRDAMREHAEHLQRRSEEDLADQLTFGKIGSKVDDLERRLLLGNGQPSFLLRLDRLEQTVKWVGLIVAAFVPLVTTVISGIILHLVMGK